MTRADNNTGHHDVAERVSDLLDREGIESVVLESQLDGDPGLRASVENNAPENARLTFDQVARDRFQDMVDSNFRLYKQVTDNEDFAKLLFDWLFERYRNRARGA